MGKSGRAHPERRAKAGPREEGGAERPGVTGPSPSRGSDSARSARAEWQCAAGQPALPSEGHGLLRPAAARPALTAATGGHAARECHCGNTFYDAFSGKYHKKLRIYRECTAGRHRLQLPPVNPALLTSEGAVTTSLRAALGSLHFSTPRSQPQVRKEPTQRPAP